MKLDNQEPRSTDTVKVERRKFLRTTGAAAMAGAVLPAVPLILPTAASASGQVPLVESRMATPAAGEVAKMSRNEVRTLHLFNDHTGDEYKVTYYAFGIYRNESLSLLNHLMRDRRANLATQMDATLYDQLFLLHKTLGSSAPVHILSGYRTAKTNAKLRSRSTGVAKYSLHMEGRAADMYVPGFTAAEIKSAAASLKAGGVGLYSRSNFVHMDTGPVRYWGS